MTADTLADGSPPAPAVTAIVVTYNSRALVEGAIASVEVAASSADLALEVIVVDNASTDGTPEFLAARRHAVQLIRNPSNLGFGRANNEAFEVARGRWWLLLNPDARLDPAALTLLVAAIQGRPRLAAVGPSIHGAGTDAAETAGMLPGLRSLAGHFLFLNRVLLGERGGPWRGWQLHARAGMLPRSVEWLSGAALLVRPSAIREAGGFDPSIFLYGEDIDLGARLIRAGWELAVVPTARAEHAIGGSQAPASVRWIGGLDGYLRRAHRSALARRACLAIIALGLAVRAVAGTSDARLRRSGHGRRMRAAFWEAARRALAPRLGDSAP